MGLLLKPAIMVSRKHRGRSDGSCLALLRRMDDHELMLFYVHGYAEGVIQHMGPCPDPGMI